MINEHIGASCPNFLHEWINFKHSSGRPCTSYDDMVSLLAAFNFHYFKLYCK